MQIRTSSQRPAQYNRPGTQGSNKGRKKDSNVGYLDRLDEMAVPVYAEVLGPYVGELIFDLSVTNVDPSLLTPG